MRSYGKPSTWFGKLKSSISRWINGRSVKIATASISTQTQVSETVYTDTEVNRNVCSATSTRPQASHQGVTATANISGVTARVPPRSRFKRGSKYRRAMTNTPCFRHTETNTAANYRCIHENCNRKFKRRVHLKLHQMAHELPTGEYKCQICGRFDFKRAHHLRLHSLRHLPTVPCYHCGRSFGCLQYLQTHQRNSQKCPSSFERQ